MSAIVVSVALLLTFALWVTVHVALAYGLIRKLRRWRLLWLLFPPAAWLAPYWGFRNRLRLASTLWLVLALTYLALLATGMSWKT